MDIPNIQTQKELRMTDQINPSLPDQSMLAHEKAFQQALKELEQYEGFQRAKCTNKQTLEELKHLLQTVLNYPSTSLAEKHRSAKRLGNLDLLKTKEPKSQVQGQQKTSYNNQNLQPCPCCSLHIQQTQISVFSKTLKDVANVGISTYMFFRTIQSLSYLLIMAYVVFGVYAFITNIFFSDFWNKNFDGFLFILKVSISPKVYVASFQTDEYNHLIIIQVWLGVALVILYIITFIYMEHVKKTELNELNKKKISASDFSILLRNVPANVDKQQVQNEIEALMQSSRYEINENGQKYDTFQQLKIVKISVAIPQLASQITKQEKQLIQLQKQQQKYRQQIVSWIKQVCRDGYFSKTAEQRKEIWKPYMQNEEKIPQIRKSINQNVNNRQQNEQDKNLTDCYVTFQFDSGKDRVLEFVKDTAFTKFIRLITFFCYSKKYSMSFGRAGQNYEVQIRQACEPEDVIWENAGVQANNRYCANIKIFFITLIILGASFGVVFGLSKLRLANSSNSYLSDFISIFIVVFNLIIAFIFRMLTVIQLSKTQTQFQSSYAFKVILAQLINTILIPILVNRFLKTENTLYDKSGLSQDIFRLGLTLSFISPLLRILDPYYFYIKYLKVWYYNRPSKKFSLHQKEFNKIYELIQFESGAEYVYVMTLYLWTCFFMSLQPVILLFSIVGYAVNYWAQKFSLFRLSQRPVPGTRKLYDKMIQLIYFGGLFYALGSSTFVNFLPFDLYSKDFRFGLTANMVAVGLGIVSVYLPYSSICSLWFPKKNSQNKRRYSDNHLNLPSEYDRKNPSTLKQAVNKYNELMKRSKFSGVNMDQADNIIKAIIDMALGNNFQPLESSIYKDRLGGSHNKNESNIQWSEGAIQKAKSFINSMPWMSK